MKQYIAVVDIGKTNKKVLIYDRALHLVEVVKQRIDEVQREGLHFEDIAGMSTWVKAQIKVMAAKYPIAAISVTTHGATIVCIDEQGKVAVPTVAYTTETAAEISDAFFARFGSREALQKETATAEIGSLINTGKMVSFLQRTFPAEFKTVRHILNFPQYFGYLFTGRIGAEATYIGCHTYLYDACNKCYSRVARELGIIDKLPPQIGKSWDVLGHVTPAISQELGLDANCIVTMGIHDSNASLLPYLVQQQDDFVLNSTGTWCVAMHPAKEINFADEELGKTVFYNQDAFSHPVKTSIFLGGMEFDTYIRLLQEINGVQQWPGDLSAATRREVKASTHFILPSVVPGVGLFPASKPCAVENHEIYPLATIQDGSRVPAFFRDFDAASAVLNLALIFQTRTALAYAGFSGKGLLYVEGDSRNDRNYMGLLAAIYPEALVASTHLEEATAFGAAILAEAALQQNTPMVTRALFNIESVRATPMDVTGVQAYFAQYLSQLQKS